MQEELKRAALEFHTAIESDPRFAALHESEKAMEQSPEVRALSLKMEAAEEAYGLALSLHDAKSPEVLAAQQALYQTKKALDEHPLVARYNQAFIVTRDLEMQFDDILFGVFRLPSLSTEAH